MRLYFPEEGREHLKLLYRKLSLLREADRLAAERRTAGAGEARVAGVGPRPNSFFF